MLNQMLNKIRNLFRKKLILVGSRNNLLDIIVAAEHSGYRIIGILDSHYWGNTNSICGIPVIGSEQELLDPNCQWRRYEFFPANWWDGRQALKSGYDADRLRQDRLDLLDRSGVRVANLVSRDVHWFHNKRNFVIGKGVLVLGNASIGADVTLGNYSVVDWDARLQYTKVGRNAIVGAASILAHVDVGDNARIGLRSTVIPSRKKDLLSVGNGAIIYIGSLVLDDVPADSVYTMYGQTRKRLKKPV